ncbi:MAG: 1-deoxy-D-xylulose-5-phosphate synthase [Oscillospiraceae bacterium]|nr:1-deoxy-D-xylulose-5-phosphate synthase [Oscillospiraceae bacterium]
MSEWKGKQLAEISEEEAKTVCAEVRDELLRSVSHTGGHLASNLGVVELTVALHRVFDFETDRLVFDVGHQCYPHKMLTGRAERMDTMRQLGGLSGFPKPNESDADAFIAGHASNSISVALGMARARTLLHRDYRVVALLGDGALTGGLAYEGLADAGGSGEKLIVILNDNGMSIKKNVGGIARLLERQHLRPGYLRFKRGYGRVLHSVPGGIHLYNLNHRIKRSIKGSFLPSTFFEDMGFDYVGPVDGHDVTELTRLLRWADNLPGPVVFHVLTTKGKGYEPAERTPEFYHGVSPFDPEQGVDPAACPRDFSAVFGETLTQLAREDARICAVTAAMQSGTGLDSFAEACPERLFDVGIAEGHAVAMCAGMAKQGMIPVFAVYSTFLQRAYDMLLHDVAMQNLHVVFAVDRAGLVGADGETHQGVFDLAYLSTVPHMTVLCPANYAELRSMLRAAVYDYDGPVAVRYPRGQECARLVQDTSAQRDCVVRPGEQFTLAGYGTMLDELLAAAEQLEAEGVSCEVVKCNQLIPLCSDHLMDSVKKTRRLLVAEEVIEHNSLGHALSFDLADQGVQMRSLILLDSGNDFVPHGTVPELRKRLGIDADSIVRRVKEALE